MKRSLVLILAVLLCGHPALAQESADPKEQETQTNSTAATGEESAAETPDGKIHVLDEVEVQEEAKELGKNTIKGRALQMTPSATGSVTEALKGMSNVQFGYEQDSSQTIGEIAPPRISISGAKPYENNFMIDGMSITNTLNPSGFDSSAGFNDLMVGGGDQTIFYDTNLLESITVYTSNVPAKYGAFMGGVIDAKLRDPRRDRSAFTLAGRYTEDAWHELRDVDSDSESPDSQPEFTIYKAGFTAEGPLGKRAALLLAGTRHESEIPLLREEPDETLIDDDQERRKENYFARLLLTPTDRLTLRFDATYAPYEELRWREAWPDSDWHNENESWRFAGQAEYETALGTFSGKVAYAQNGDSRDTASNYRYLLMNLGDDTQDDTYGGVGDADIDNKEVGIEVSFESKDQKKGSFQWNFASGLQFGYKHTDSWNQAAGSETMILYAPGGSTISRHTVASYDEVDQSHRLATLGFYAQGDLAWKRLTLTPGVRVDYDDFSNNTDIAPRLKAEFDTFGNGTLRFIGGANRYYGSHLRSYAFDRYRPFHRTQTVVRTSGTTTTSTEGADNDYETGGLDTPYSDEFTGGVAGNIFGFDYGIEFVHRQHKDQLISKTDDGDNYYITNDGESTFNGLTVSLSKTLHTRRFGNHSFELSATKSKTKTFNGSYDSDVDLDETSYGYEYGYDKVFYNGEYISRSDMPADNYNAPLVLALTLDSGFFEDRLRFHTVARWRDSADGLVDDKRVNGETPYGTTRGSETRTSSLWVNEDGGYSDAYKEETIDGGLVADLTVEYDAFKKDRYCLTFIVEVLNLFDNKSETSVAEGGATSRGRGFYAGLQAAF